jgi:hypothetical protein
VSRHCKRREIANLIDKTAADSHQDSAVAESEPDRREYFRVDDRATLRYQIVPADVVGHTPAERHFDNSEIFELLRDLRQIDQEHNNVLRGIAEQNRELGVYLKSITRKIELIANALTAVDQTQHKQVPQPVSISETSIAFKIDPSLPTGSFVAIELVLMPTHTALALYGEVVDSRESDDGMTVVSFVRLRDGDRQILARHILQVQILAKKQSQSAVSE